MSEKFADLKKIPEQPAARLLAATGTKLNAELSLPASASVSAMLMALLDLEAWVDMMRLMAVALPPREAVWWGCIAAREVHGDSELTPCLKAAEAWVFEPNDANREKLQMALDAVDMDDDTALVATAALYASGTMGMGDMEEIPAPPAAVSSCVFGMNMMTLSDAEDPIAQMRWVIDRALDIARGGNGKVDRPAPLEASAPAEKEGQN